MASGVRVDDSVLETYDKMQKPPPKSQKTERLKIMLMKLSEKKDFIEVDRENTRYLSDFDDQEDIFKAVMNLFKDGECRFAVYDCFYDTKECGCKEDLVFITWCPDSAGVKEKMVYTSSCQALKAKLPKIRHHLQLNDKGDKIPDCILQKMGKDTVMLEGKPV